MTCMDDWGEIIKLITEKLQYDQLTLEELQRDMERLETRIFICEAEIERGKASNEHRKL